MRLRLKFIILFLFLLQFSKAYVVNDDIIENSRKTDSLNLLLFALHTQSELWKIKWDFNQPLDLWHGVELNNLGRVFCIDLDGVDDCNASKNGGNHLHGTLPELQLPFLEHLFLSSNKIKGKIPSFKGCPNLLTLQLSGNRFEGEIPSLNHLKKIKKIDLEYNQLTGKIPDFSMNELEVLYLGFNYLYGNIPEFLSLKKLKHLYINHNQLSGGLPHFFHLNQLEHFIFNHNQFEGPLPNYFKILSLQILIGNNNQLSGCIEEVKYKNFFLFKVNDNQLFNCNTISEKIPSAFSPNGDGVNDFFVIDNTENKIVISVWNTRGVLVYHTDDYHNNWDGTDYKNNKKLPEGFYVLYVQIGEYQNKKMILIKY